MLNLTRTLSIIVCSLLINSCSSYRPMEKIVHGTYGAEFSYPTHRAESQNGMVVSQGTLTSQAGEEMLRLGGNAADAATAMTFAISVERPQSTGIGGGGFLLYQVGGATDVRAMDFREKAPLKSHPKIFLKKNGEVDARKSLDGIHAVAVPTLVAGIVEFHRRHGKLPLQTVLAPAIKMAENGFDVYPELERALAYRETQLAKDPEAKKIFFQPDGKRLALGDVLVQSDLGKTLRAIALQEEKGFYGGFVLEGILKTSKFYQGPITAADFEKPLFKEREPVAGDFKGFKIYSMPPPSSGGIHVLQILNTIENDQLHSRGPMHADSIHLLSSSMQQAFADRAAHLGDADFVHVPIEELTSKEYAKDIRRKFILRKARKAEEVMAGEFDLKKEPDHTTHFTVMDKDGFVVSSTQTINGYFGSAVVAEGTGIVLNNEMDDFSAKPGASNLFGAIGSTKNEVRPEKRPLSSMSPTIVTLSGKPVLALGSPSGTRILTCVAQTILNYLEYDLDLFESVAMVRYHHQWKPDYIRVDEPGFPEQVTKKLESFGYQVKMKNLGCRVQAIAREGEKVIGVSDPRGRGLAIGI